LIRQMRSAALVLVAPASRLSRCKRDRTFLGVILGCETIDRAADPSCIGTSGMLALPNRQR
jgi:hypothetical protein